MISSISDDSHRIYLLILQGFTLLLVGQIVFATACILIVLKAGIL